MVDSRLRGEWLGSPRFDDLSDTAWRVFTGALMWSNQQGKDGLVPARYLPRLHPDGPQPDAVSELVHAGLAELAADGALQLLGWVDDLGQSSAEKVTEYRTKARDRMRRNRQKPSEPSVEEPSSVPVRANVPQNLPENATPNVGRGLGIGQEVLEPAPYASGSAPHASEPNARRRLAELHLPLDLDELLTAAYRLGHGDPWAGYLQVRHRAEATDLAGAKSASGLLRHVLKADAPRPRDPRASTADDECPQHPGYPSTRLLPCEACKRDAKEHQHQEDAA